MSVADTDGRGRIYLPKHVRDRYGKRFRIVELEDGVKLVPVDEDPVEGLRQAAAELKDADMDSVEHEIEEEVEDELMD